MTIETKEGGEQEQEQSTEQTAEQIAAAEAAAQAAKQPQVDLEKFLELPSKDATPEQIAKAFERLGAISKPEDLADIAKDDAGFDAMKNTFIEAKVTKGQVEKIYSGFNEYINTQMTAIKTKNEENMNTLKKEWGNDFDNNVNQAKDVVSKLGLSKEDIQGLEVSIKDSALVLKIFHAIAKATSDGTIKVGEHSGDSNYVASNPADASAKIAALMKDPAFAEKIAKGDPEASRIFGELHKVRYPGGRP